MSKILVQLEVPSVETSYDVMLPDDMEIQVLIRVLTEAVESLTNRRYMSSGQSMLCLRNPDTLLMQNRTLYHYNIKNCDRLVLL